MHILFECIRSFNEVCLQQRRITAQLANAPLVSTFVEAARRPLSGNGV
jgi:hypothetical protein